MQFYDDDPHGPDESYYIIENGGSVELREKYTIYLHAANSITPPDFPEDQMAAIDVLFDRDDLTDQQIVAELAKILL